MQNLSINPAQLEKIQQLAKRSEALAVLLFGFDPASTLSPDHVQEMQSLMVDLLHELNETLQTPPPMYATLNGDES